MRMIRLSELVQQGRAALVAEAPEEDVARTPPAAPALPPQPMPAAVAQAPPRRSAPVDVVERIELLAVHLLSISKLRKTDPDGVMREALISIDQCLASIAHRH